MIQEIGVEFFSQACDELGFTHEQRENVLQTFDVFISGGCARFYKPELDFMEKAIRALDAGVDTGSGHMRINWGAAGRLMQS